MVPCDRPKGCPVLRWRHGLRRIEGPASPPEQIVFEELIQRIDVAYARQGRDENAIRKLLSAWSMAPVVTAIHALRGVVLMSAVTLVAEIGDVGGFASPRQLMAWRG